MRSPPIIPFFIVVYLIGFETYYLFIYFWVLPFMVKDALLGWCGLFIFIFIFYTLCGCSFLSLDFAREWLAYHCLILWSRWGCTSVFFFFLFFALWQPLYTCYVFNKLFFCLLFLFYFILFYFYFYNLEGKW